MMRPYIKSLRKRQLKLVVWAFAITLVAALHSSAQVCGTPGKDGHGGTLSGVVNTYYPGNATASAGATSITLGTSRGASTSITSGDLLLVIQMQDAAINSNNNSRYGDGVNGDPGSGYSAANNTGAYEFVRATNAVALTGGTLNLQGLGSGSGLLNTYTNSAATSSQGQRRFQVIRVPQYASATLSSSLTASAWNGTTGGVLSIDVTGTLTLGGTVSVSGLGFRGGATFEIDGGSATDTDYRNLASIDAHGRKGEGIAGTPRYLFVPSSGTILDTGLEGYPNGSAARGAPGTAGGGGSDGNPTVNDENSGGGGGGNGGAGGQGGNTWRSDEARGGFGGVAFSEAAAGRVVLGGGGGSGTRNNDDGNDSASSGGAGGGIVLMRAWTVVGTGTINADGSAAYNDTLNDGGGGGGAGGSVLFWVQTGSLTGLTVTARGGRGGDAWRTQAPNGTPGERHGPGGGGGGGFVLLSTAAASVTVTGGTNGITTTSSASYEATPGGNGSSATTLTAAQIPGVSSGATCTTKPTVVALDSFEGFVVNGRVTLKWKTGFETDNLGFNLYREEDGQLIPLNQSLIAGSALQSSANLTTGRSYSWTDSSAVYHSAARYWLEDVDLSGNKGWHGPVVPSLSAQDFAASDSVVIEEVGQTADSDQTGAVVERSTKKQKLSAAELTLHSSLASGAAVKLSVRKEGWYRVTRDELVAAGFSPSVNPHLLQLFVDGQEQPLLVGGAGDNRFDSGDYIEFYGTGASTPWTDTRVYWLVPGSRAGNRIKNLPSPSKLPGAASYLNTVERADRFVYFSALSNGDTENFFGAVVTSRAVDQSLVLTGNETGSVKEASLEIKLQGVTFVPHQVQVTLNGFPLGSVTFNGKDAGSSRFVFPSSLLREGENKVTLAAVAGAIDISVVSSIRISHWRLYQATNNYLRFTATGNTQIQLLGFTEAGVRVVDVTSPSNPVEVPIETVKADPGKGGSSGKGGSGGTGGTGGKSQVISNVLVSIPGTGARTLLAFTGTAMSKPSLKANESSALASPSMAADLVIIAPASLKQSVQPLKTQRESQGLTVVVADTEDVYDEFSAGQKTPYAVREFLRYAVTGWSKRPRWVLLVGDATYDPRNYIGGASGDLVPTKLVDTFLMETSSDSWFTDFNGDYVGDIAIGRIPVRTAAQASSLIDKILQYERSTPATGSALLIADRDDEGFSFEASSNGVVPLLPSGTAIEKVFLASLGESQARTNIRDGLNKGPKVVNYSGHGSLDFWRGDLLTTAMRPGSRIQTTVYSY